MAKEQIPFSAFRGDVAPEHREYVVSLHEYLLANGCKEKIELKSSGHLVSYSHKPSKRVLLNFVFRKKGLIARIYGDFVNDYEAFLDKLPAGMLKSIAKAPVCKRLLNPDACNSRCPMGYAFTAGGDTHKKCRYSCFMFEASAENNEFIREFVENEIKARAAALRA